jgi:hypothetical protein
VHSREPARTRLNAGAPVQHPELALPKPGVRGSSPLRDASFQRLSWFLHLVISVQMQRRCKPESATRPPRSKRPCRKSCGRSKNADLPRALTRCQRKHRDHRRTPLRWSVPYLASPVTPSGSNQTLGTDRHVSKGRRADRFLPNFRAASAWRHKRLFERWQ